MKIDNNSIKYTGLSILAGLFSLAIITLFWSLIAGVGMKVLALASVSYIIWWGCAGFVGWLVVKDSKRLASVTYFMASLFFLITAFLYGLFSDPSIKAWVILYFIGFLICSIPSFLLLKILVIPHIIHPRNTSKEK